MMGHFKKALCFTLCHFLLGSASSPAQTPAAPPLAAQQDADALKKTAPKVFIAGDYVDQNFIKTEIIFVNYVRDPKEAHVYILISTLATGSGGVEYTITFSGQNEFKGLDDIQKYASNRTQTADEIRQGIVRVLKMGLMRYVAKTPIGEKIGIVFKESVKPTAVVDKWDFWVFSLSGRTSLNGQKSMKNTYLSGSFSANRTTPESKIRTSLYISGSKDEFTYDATTISSSTKSKSFSGMAVKSLGEHWSAGAYVSASASTYSNLKFCLTTAPAIEYDFFPYSQSTRRQLTLLYRFNFSMTKYNSETIYYKTSENLLGESLALTLSLKEKWGSASVAIQGAHYFHDFSKNHLDVYGDLSLRILKGLNFNVFGAYSLIHDQLSLPIGGATLEEVLLRRTMLETDYSYYFSIGLSYTFGSIYSNVVNPRFGGGSSGMVYYY
jgi:hypothetical protein